MDYCVTATSASSGGYTEASVGHCDAAAGMHPLTSIEDCGAAAAALGKSDTTASDVDDHSYPDGCYYKQSTGELYFNSNGDTSSVDTDRISLCGDGVVHAGETAGRDWTELSDKFCDSSSHIGTLHSMADATASCLADSSCVYIYDQSCDGTGDFVTCRQTTLTDSTSGSCVYQHDGGVLHHSDDPACATGVAFYATGGTGTGSAAVNGPYTAQGSQSHDKPVYCGGPSGSQCIYYCGNSVWKQRPRSGGFTCNGWYLGQSGSSTSSLPPMGDWASGNGAGGDNHGECSAGVESCYPTLVECLDTGDGSGSWSDPGSGICVEHETEAYCGDYQTEVSVNNGDSPLASADDCYSVCTSSGHASRFITFITAGGSAGSCICTTGDGQCSSTSHSAASSSNNYNAYTIFLCDASTVGTAAGPSAEPASTTMCSNQDGYAGYMFVDSGHPTGYTTPAPTRRPEGDGVGGANCRNLCAADATCVGFMWYGSTSHCYTYTALTNSWDEDADAVSYRKCSGSSMAAGPSAEPSYGGSWSDPGSEVCKYKATKFRGSVRFWAYFDTAVPLSQMSFSYHSGNDPHATGDWHDLSGDANGATPGWVHSGQWTAGNTNYVQKLTVNGVDTAWYIEPDDSITPSSSSAPGSGPCNGAPWGCASLGMCHATTSCSTECMAAGPSAEPNYGYEPTGEPWSYEPAMEPYQGPSAEPYDLPRGESVEPGGEPGGDTASVAIPIATC